MNRRPGWIPDVDHVHAIEREAGRLAERALATARALASARERPEAEEAGEPAPGKPGGGADAASGEAPPPADRPADRAGPADPLVDGAARALEALGTRLRLSFFWGKPSLHRMVMVRNAALLLVAARAAARAEIEVEGLAVPGLGDLARDAVGLAGRLLETVPGWGNRGLVRLGRRLARRGEAPGPGGLAAFALAEEAIERIAALDLGFGVGPDRLDLGAGEAPGSDEPSPPRDPVRGEDGMATA